MILLVNIFNTVYYCFYIYSRGSDTILGETADPLELFLVDDCESIKLESALKKVKVSIDLKLFDSLHFSIKKIEPGRVKTEFE